MPATTRSIIKDQDGLPIPQGFSLDADAYDALNTSHEGGSLLVGSIRQALKDDFPGSAIDANKWTVVQTGTGHTITVTSSELRIATGVTASTETIIRSVKTFKPACRVQFYASVSQRIINQEFYLELANSAGDVYARWLLEGATNTQARAQVGNAGQAGPNNATYITGLTASSTLQVFEVDMFVDETWFGTRLIDSTAARAGTAVRNRANPDPDTDLYVQVRVLNLATAPASTTTLTIDAISVQDIAELTAEVTGGRGGAGIAGSVPVLVNSMPTITINAPAMGEHQRFIWYDDTTTALAASAVFNGTSRDMAVQASGTVTAAGAGYDEFRAAARADQAGTLHIDQSRDATNWFSMGSVAVPADVNAWTTIERKVFMRYARVRYVNGATTNTVLNVTSVTAQS